MRKWRFNNKELGEMLLYLRMMYLILVPATSFKCNVISVHLLMLEGKLVKCVTLICSTIDLNIHFFVLFKILSGKIVCFS